MRTILPAGTILLLSTTAAHAQTEPPSTSVAETGDDIVVVGSRAAPRLRTDTPAPVDVLSSETLQAQGFDSLARKLEFLSPSFNYVPATTSPSAEGTRPATLRGLTPDQVLVLVNGHRRHAAATINTNNGIGRGTVPVDLNTIPEDAIARVEILRDGAAAQYGSDAIAGVINIVLRSDRDGGYASGQTGITERGDGSTQAATVRHGFAIGDTGFLTIAGEVRSRDFTNAAAVDPRFGRITQRLGDPRSLDVNTALNMEVPLGPVTLYGDATVSGRRTLSSPLFRLPTVAPTFYPQGFLPLVRQKTFDTGGTLGLRGAIAGWDWEASDTAGYNNADFRVSNSVNTSLGAMSPRSFDGGSQRYFQNIAALTMGRAFDVLAGAHLTVGAEHRYERYTLRKGEPRSYQGAGAQGFPGYNPPSPVDPHRTAVSVFADAELSPITGLDLGAAVRYEDYNDFGSRAIWKGSLFWRPMSFAALRSTISSGFRAPSLQQQFFSTVTSQLSNGVLVNVGNFAVNDPVAIALGATPLKAETSKSYTGGLVLTPMKRLDLSIDVYRIDIRNRITFSESLGGAAVNAILLSNGITNASQVRFFTNAADTRSQGIEATLHWAAGARQTGLFDLSVGYGGFVNKLRGLRANTVLPTLPLLGLTSIGVLIDSQPLSKVTANAAFTAGPFRISGNVVNFGPFRAAPLGRVQRFGPSTVVDLAAGIETGGDTKFDIGVNNLTDAFPDQVIGQTDGRLYTEAGGLNFNGREYFVRFAVRF